MSFGGNVTPRRFGAGGDKHKKQADWPGEGKISWKCPECGRWNEDHWLVCPVCGASNPGD